MYKNKRKTIFPNYCYYILIHFLLNFFSLSLLTIWKGPSNEMQENNKTIHSGLMLSYNFSALSYLLLYLIFLILIKKIKLRSLISYPSNIQSCELHLPPLQYPVITWASSPTRPISSHYVSFISHPSNTQSLCELHLPSLPHRHYVSFLSHPSNIQSCELHLSCFQYPVIMWASSPNPALWSYQSIPPLLAYYDTLNGSRDLKCA